MMFNTTFYVRRLHSLVGLVILGVVIFEHVFTNATSLLGPEGLNSALSMMELIPKPIFYGLEIFGIAIPLLFHAGYGIYIALQAKCNPGRFGYIRNWMFTLQRWTAWYLVPFLLWHIIYLRIYTKGICGIPISYELLDNYFQNPIVVVLYTIGMFAAIFHFCNGITTFMMTWGFAKGPRCQNVISVLSMLLCAFLCLVTLAFMGHYVLF
jgi:succinate dehydrogenase / fumarate reductase cytochrome b subunit